MKFIASRELRKEKQEGNQNIARCLKAVKVRQLFTTTTLAKTYSRSDLSKTNNKSFLSWLIIPTSTCYPFNMTGNEDTGAS